MGSSAAWRYASVVIHPMKLDMAFKERLLSGQEERPKLLDHERELLCQWVAKKLDLIFCGLLYAS